MATAKKTFEATLEPLDDGLGWVVAWLPFYVAKVWPKMVRLRVCVRVGGEEFRTSLFSARQAGVPQERIAKRSGHFVLANKKMQRAAGVGVGGRMKFEMWPDLEERKGVLAPEVAAIFKTEKELARWYDKQLSESTKFAITKWIDEAKSAASRAKRAAQLAERLYATMEAEVELPPVIAAAFRRRPKAKAGWEKMTAAQRRGELMAVFYYQSPEAREKRVGKLCDLAEAKAG